MMLEMMKLIRGIACMIQVFLFNAGHYVTNKY